MKLTHYADLAATEYFLETGDSALDARWIAEFFQDSGVLDEYPALDLVTFAAMVQKALILRSERAEKLARSQLTRIVRWVDYNKHPRKS